MIQYLSLTILSDSSTIDEFHNWYDVLAGAVIGTVMAFSGYRMVYASVWDFRFNHIPLNRHFAFTYGGGGPGAGLHSYSMWTRQAGWGSDMGGYGGAPFDSAGGMGSGVASGIGAQGGGGHRGIPRRPVVGHNNDNVV